MNILILIACSFVLVIVLFFFIGLYVAAAISKKRTKKSFNDIYDASPYRQDRKKPVAKKSDEFQSRDERKEVVTGKAKSQDYIKLQQKEFELENEEGLVKVEKDIKPELRNKDETVIVGISQPVGFWSRLIMSQKLGFLMSFQHQMKQNKGGYFVNLVKAQARSQGKEKGRGL